MKTPRQAFTLVELIVVLGILALLLVLITPRVAGYVQSASDTTAKANARAVMDASDLYLMDMALEGTSPAGTLTTGGPLDAYLKLQADDTYTLTLTQADGDDSHAHYTGSYSRGDQTVLIPSLEAEGQPPETE